MRYLIVLLLLTLVMDLTARHPEDYYMIVCYKKPSKSKGTPEERCNRWCRKKAKRCQRGKCMEIKGRKTCSCLDCDPTDKTRDQYPPVPLEPLDERYEVHFHV
ncbi:hypothetical protein Aduo_003201 [Ancylostoma duodenale]